MIMKCNVGKTDRAVRIVAGVVMIAVGLYFQNWWGAIGIVPIATGLLRWCPAYLPFGIKTP
jgi:sulfite exporter TauE/SafE